MKPIIYQCFKCDEFELHKVDVLIGAYWEVELTQPAVKFNLMKAFSKPHGHAEAERKGRIYRGHVANGEP